MKIIKNLWKFNLEPNASYGHEYDFIRFTHDHQLQYLNLSNQLIRTDQIEINQKGQQIIKDSSSFKRFELINFEELNLVYDSTIDDREPAEIKFNFRRCDKTIVKVSEEIFEKIRSDSRWEVQVEGRESKKGQVEFSTYTKEGLSKDGKPLVSRYIDSSFTTHLISIDDTWMAVQKSRGVLTFNGVLTRIAEYEMEGAIQFFGTLKIIYKRLP